MMLRPTVGGLVARVITSTLAALPMKAPMVVTTHESIGRIRPSCADEYGEGQRDVDQTDE